ncbi:MAG TPA: hypothetical protein VMD07_05985, partial [Candidatus Acidoferrales bacterium]|nr:hypothetical protein [Candidatus Acidoferrales bacterium]
MRRASALATLMVVVALTACGGGGGSSTPGSAPQNPGAPISTSPATSSPGTGSTPTPAPTMPGGSSTPTPTPTNATAAPQGPTILPNTSGHLGLIQLADNYGSPGIGAFSASQIQSEAPYYNAVWASFEPSTWTQYHPGMILSRYEVPFEDEYLISGHDLAWFQQNEPSWVLYGCTSNGTPTSDVAWSGTHFQNDVPLNIDNPDVVSYEVNQLVSYMLANGYNALAVDQVVFENFLLSPNPEVGEGNPVSGSYGCGIYPQGPQNGNFQRIYGTASGGELYNSNDTTFNDDIINWLAAAHTALSQYNLKLLVNHPIGTSSPTSLEQQMLQYVDGVVVENGYTNYGEYATSGLPGAFVNTHSWLEDVQTMSPAKAVFIAYYYCESNCSTNASALTASQVDWALSTYALSNAGGADAYIVPYGVDDYSYRSEYASDNYGAACGSMTQSGDVYTQQFQNGMAIVNASYSSASV